MSFLGLAGKLDARRIQNKLKKCKEAIDEAGDGIIGRKLNIMAEICLELTFDWLFL